MSMYFKKEDVRVFVKDGRFDFGPVDGGNGDRKAVLQGLPRTPVKKAKTPRQIVVVEDNLDGVHSLVLLLRDMGHQVEYAINGYAALDLVKRLKPEIVLLDLQLPGLNGFEVCKRIKKGPALNHIHVIALTAFSQEEYRQSAMSAGCEKFLVKPVDAKTFEEVLA